MDRSSPAAPGRFVISGSPDDAGQGDHILFFANLEHDSCPSRPPRQEINLSLVRAVTNEQVP